MIDPAVSQRSGRGFLHPSPDPFPFGALAEGHYRFISGIAQS
jgi:hypothetical protein